MSEFELRTLETMANQITSVKAGPPQLALIGHSMLT